MNAKPSPNVPPLNNEEIERLRAKFHEDQDAGWRAAEQRKANQEEEKKRRPPTA